MCQRPVFLTAFYFESFACKKVYHRGRSWLCLYNSPISRSGIQVKRDCSEPPLAHSTSFSPAPRLALFIIFPAHSWQTSLAPTRERNSSFTISISCGSGTIEVGQPWAHIDEGPCVWWQYLGSQNAGKGPAGGKGPPVNDCGHTGVRTRREYVGEAGGLRWRHWKWGGERISNCKMLRGKN